MYKLRTLTERIKEYAVCEKRGHKGSDYVTIDGWEICRFCDTQFTIVEKVIERTQPIEQETKDLIVKLKE